jgi:hypothetical protein
VPADPDCISSFLNIRVADIKAYYELWGAELITEPKVHPLGFKKGSKWGSYGP